MPSQLSALANIISSGVQTLESAYAENGRTYPSLDDPFDPSGLDQDRVLVETRRLIVAAATQIIACVRPPAETVLESMAGACTTTTLGFIADTNVVDILKEAGPSVGSRIHHAMICAHLAHLTAGASCTGSFCPNWSGRFLFGYASNTRHHELQPHSIPSPCSALSSNASSIQRNHSQCVYKQPYLLGPHQYKKYERNRSGVRISSSKLRQ